MPVNRRTLQEQTPQACVSEQHCQQQVGVLFCHVIQGPSWFMQGLIRMQGCQ